jgi:hypothetical protein
VDLSSGSLFSSLGGLLGMPGSGMFSSLSGLIGGGPKPSVAPNSAGSSIMSGLSSILGAGKTGGAAVRALENSPASNQFAINTTADVQAAAANSSSIFMVMINYDGPNPPKGAFGKFENLKSTIDYTKTQPYSSVIGMSDAAFDYLSMHTSFRVSTPATRPPCKITNLLPEHFSSIPTQQPHILRRNRRSLEQHLTVLHQACKGHRHSHNRLSTLPPHYRPSIC